MRTRSYHRDSGLACANDNWYFKDFLYAIVFLTLFFSIAEASTLKDIRIGEYEGFTRMVFEFDTRIDSHTISSTAPATIKIIFPDASPLLKRRIPTERSSRIEELELWNRQTEICAVIRFSYESIRHESFVLNEPFRVALDVYPTDYKTVIGIPSASETGFTEPPVQDSEPQSLTKEEPLQIIDDHKDGSTPSAWSISTNQQTEKEFWSNNNKTDKSLDRDSVNDTALVGNDLSTASAAAQKMKSGANLQYYLIITLVLFTTLIVFLLIAMLLAWHCWSCDKVYTDRARHQDDRHEEKNVLKPMKQRPSKRSD